MAHRAYTGRHNYNINKTDRDSKSIGKDKYSSCDSRNLGQSNNWKVFQNNSSSSDCSPQE